MDLIKVVEIDDKIHLYRCNFPFQSDVFTTNLANLPNDFRDKKISVCVNYIDSIKDWVKEQEPQYLDRVKIGIEGIHSFAKLSRQEVCLEFASFVEDYFINLPEWMSFSDNLNTLIDRNNGYPICDDLLSSNNLKQYINPVYIGAINTYEYLLRLVEDQLSYIINDLQTKIENAQSDKVTDVAESDLPKIILLAEADSHKILLLHELGIIEYLTKKYNENDITDIATLLSFITDINHSTLRSGIRQYQKQGKGDIYNKTSLRAINKILIDAKLTPIEFKKV